jgi:hypothetical protein
LMGPPPAMSMVRGTTQRQSSPWHRTATLYRFGLERMVTSGEAAVSVPCLIQRTVGLALTSEKTRTPMS